VPPASALPYSIPGWEQISPPPFVQVACILKTARATRVGRRIGGWQRPNARRQTWLETRSPVPTFPTDPDDCLRFLRAAQPALEIHRHVVVTEGWDSIVLLLTLRWG